MDLVRIFMSRLTALFRRRQLNEQLDEELQAHLELAIQDKMNRGISGPEARAVALREFGGIAQIKEVYRTQREFPFVESIWRDTFYAVRGFRRAPVFAIVATLSLALGLGANIAIFAVMDVVLVRPLPVEKPNELEQIGVATDKGVDYAISFPLFRELAFRDKAFTQIFLYAEAPISLVADQRAERGVAQVVSGNYFTTLGIRPLIGRLIGPDDNRIPMASPVAMLSYYAWRERFALDPNVIGRTIQINSHPFIVVGVAPRAFSGMEVGTVPDVWVPAMMQPAIFGPAGRQSFNANDWKCWRVFGRRSSGVTEAAAQSQLNVAFREIRDKIRDSNSANPALTSISLASGSRGVSRVRDTFEDPILLLMAVVASVLLIACVNIAGIQSARCAARRKESAMRIALGASRARLIQQSLIEGILLSIFGGLFGAILAVAGIQMLMAFLPVSRLPLALIVHIDARAVAFAAVLSLLVGTVLGLVPTLSDPRRETAESLKPLNRSVAVGSRRIELRKCMVCIQITLSLLLVSTAALFLESLSKANAVQTGLKMDNVVMGTVNPAQLGYSQMQVRKFYQQLQSQLEQIPDLHGVGSSEVIPFSGEFEQSPISTSSAYNPQAAKSILVNKVGGSFFDIAGIRVIQGRGFDNQLGPNQPLVALVSQSAAKDLFVDGVAIGNTVSLGPGLPQNVKIIGIVSNSIYRDIRDEAPRVLYLSFAQEADPTRERTIFLSQDVDSTRSIELLRGAVRKLDQNLPIYDVKTFTEQKAESLASNRLVAILSAFFGALALLLAGIGLYGVLAYEVERRTAEIGIRMSLGASRGRVLWMVIRRTLFMVGGGVALAIPLGRLCFSLIASLLFEVSPNSPLLFAASCCVLTLVALLAAASPAWRAARINPLLAIREN